MEQIRCDIYTDHNINGEIVDGCLRLNIINYDYAYEPIDSEIYLSVASINNLIHQLQLALQILDE